MSRGGYDETVLAIYPTARGLAYVFFQAPLTPVDWGLKRLRVKKKNAPSLAIVVRLCEVLHPDVVVIEDSAASSCRRSKRIRRLLGMIATHAATENLTVARYSKEAVQSTFREAGAITRYEIAEAIASFIPALAHKMPRAVKKWQSEDERLSLFGAAALALTHFAVVPDDAEPP